MYIRLLPETRTPYRYHRTIPPITFDADGIDAADGSKNKSKNNRSNEQHTKTLTAQHTNPMCRSHSSECRETTTSHLPSSSAPTTTRMTVIRSSSGPSRASRVRSATFRARVHSATSDASRRRQAPTRTRTSRARVPSAASDASRSCQAA